MLCRSDHHVAACACVLIHSCALPPEVKCPQALKLWQNAQLCGIKRCAPTQAKTAQARHQMGLSGRWWCQWGCRRVGRGLGRLRKPCQGCHASGIHYLKVCQAAST
jgi:hypothetical protein